MTTPENDVTYTSVEPSDLLLNAATSAAWACCTEEFRELDCDILSAKNLTTASALALFGNLADGPYPIDPATIWRVDWQLWVCVAKFNHKYPWQIELMKEHIYIDEKTLLDRDAVTYIMGPEYNWLEWQDDQQTTMEIDDARAPKAVLDGFCDLVETSWSENIREHFEDELPSEALPQQLRQVILKVLAEA